MGKLYESEKLARGGSKERAHDENGRFTSMVQNDPLRAKQLSTCERIAAQNGVGAATVKRAEKYAKGVDAAEDAVPGEREEILTGRIKATDAEITALAKTPKAEIPAALAELRKPKQERQPRKAETASSKQTLSEISKSMARFLALYQGEYSRERLVGRLRTVHPKTITRLAQNGTGNVADRHMKQILSIYNGAGRAHSLPCKR